MQGRYPRPAWFGRVKAEIVDWCAHGRPFQGVGLRMLAVTAEYRFASRLQRLRVVRLGNELCILLRMAQREDKAADARALVY